MIGLVVVIFFDWDDRSYMCVLRGRDGTMVFMIISVCSMYTICLQVVQDIVWVEIWLRVYY